MQIGLIIFILTSLLFCFLYLNEKNKTKKVKKEILKFENFKRIGYYEHDCTQTNKNEEISYTGRYNVIELDRYKNGDSKIELQELEIINIDNNRLVKNSAFSYLRDNFKSIKKTDDITWLESVDEIKKIRKMKMDQLKKYLK